MISEKYQISGILFVTPFMPAMGGTGVRMRCGQHLEALSKIAPVHLVLIDERGQSALDACASDVQVLTESMRVMAPGRAYTAGWSSFRSSKSRWAALARLPGLPTQQAFAPSPQEAGILAKELRALDADIVFAFHLRAATWFDGIEAVCGRWLAAKLVDSDDIQWKMLLRTHLGAWRKSTPLGNILRMREIFEMWVAERKALMWDALACCSEKDSIELSARSRRAVVHTIPNTVRIPQQPLPLRHPGSTINLVFVGSLGYAPNIDAVAWFYQSIWPRIAETLGDRVRLFLVGREPAPSIQALHAPPQIIVTGSVPDVFPFYESADIVIAPIRFGGGTRIKIIEAWSYARPVVSTTLGAEGLNVVADKHALIADSPTAFADAVLALAHDDGLRRRLGASGYELACRSYSQTTADTAVIKMLMSVCDATC